MRSPKFLRSVCPYSGASDVPFRNITILVYYFLSVTSLFLLCKRKNSSDLRSNFGCNIRNSSAGVSLYEAEKDDMNHFESQLMDAMVELDNVRWWHRINERKGMRLNAFINHYLDFIVKTESGKILLLEAKGDYLDGDNSKTKLKLGRHWQAKAENIYKYFMVFDKKAIQADGAYTMDKLIGEILREFSM